MAWNEGATGLLEFRAPDDAGFGGDISCRVAQGGHCGTPCFDRPGMCAVLCAQTPVGR